MFTKNTPFYTGKESKFRIPKRILVVYSWLPMGFIELGSFLVSGVDFLKPSFDKRLVFWMFIQEDRLNFKRRQPVNMDLSLFNRLCWSRRIWHTDERQESANVSNLTVIFFRLWLLISLNWVIWAWIFNFRALLRQVIRGDRRLPGCFNLANKNHSLKMSIFQRQIRV